MSVNPTQAYTNPRLQTHQSAVGSSLYLQTPMPTVLSNYLPASTARTALLNSRFTIQSGVAASRLSQGSGHTFSQSLSNPSQFALTNVAWAHAQRLSAAAALRYERNFSNFWVIFFCRIRKDESPQEAYHFEGRPVNKVWKNKQKVYVCDLMTEQSDLGEKEKQ